MLKTNVNAYESLLKIAIRHNANMIYASSAATYGDSNRFEVGFEKRNNVYGFSKVVYRRKTDRPSNLNNGVISAVRQINRKLIEAKSDYEIYTQSHGCKGSTVRFMKKTPPRPKDARAKAGSKRKLK